MSTRSNRENEKRSSKRDKKQGAADVIAALARINELSECDRTTTQQAANMLVEQRELIAQLIAKVRWLSGEPYRPSREKVMPGQLALDFLGLLAGKDRSADHGNGNGDADEGDQDEDGPVAK